MLDTRSPQQEPQRPIDRRRARTRHEIIEAAWTLSRSGGLASLSLRDLAAEVGMRAPSLYSYFDSKDAIYDAMFAEGQRELLELVDQLPTDGPPRDVLGAAAHTFFDFCTDDPVRYQLMFQRVVPGFEPSADGYALALEILERFSAVLTAAGVGDRRHVDLFTAFMTGLTDQQISNDPGGDRWRRLLDEAVDMLCDHAGIPPTKTVREEAP